jgi:hypothetical protein
MAATHIASDGTLNDQPGIPALVDLGAGHATDATNGNVADNNGLVMLYVTATAADATFSVKRPEGPAQAYNIAVTGHLYVLGPFEVDEFGPSINWTGLATTTVRVAQLAIP